MTHRPVLILKQDVPAMYGFSERMIKRWIVEKRISHVHPSGKTGPCWLLTAELDALIEATTTPAVKRSKRAS